MEVFIRKQDLGNIDVFKEIYDFIDSQRDSTVNTLTLLKFKEATEATEEKSRLFIKHSGNKIAEISHNYIETSLSVFLYVLKRGGLLERPILYAYFRYLNFINLVFDVNTSTSNELFFSRNFTVNFPSLIGPKSMYDFYSIKNYFEKGVPTNLVEGHPFYLKIDFKDLEKSINNDFNLLNKTYLPYHKDIEIIKLFQRDFLVKQFIFDPHTNKLLLQNEYYEYIVDLNIIKKNNDAQAMTSSLYKILTSISGIENVEVEFEHLEMGSIIARLRVKMKNYVAKKEVKEFFILLKELIFSLASNGKISSVETLKKIAEIEKLELEKKLIKRKLDSEPSINLINKQHLLDIEKKQLENQRKGIENTAMKLSNIKTVVELAKDGILESDFIKVDLNGIGYILNHSENIVDSEEDIDKMT